MIIILMMDVLLGIKWEAMDENKFNSHYAALAKQAFSELVRDFSGVINEQFLQTRCWFILQS